MIPLFCSDVTLDKENVEDNCEPFVTAMPSKAMSDALDNTIENVAEFEKNAKLPLFYRIIQWVFGCLAFISAAGIIEVISEAEDLTFADSYKTAPWLFWLVGAMFIIWGFLTVLSILKMREAYKSDEGQLLDSKYDRMADSIFMELGVPANAETVDVITFDYKIKNGAIKIKEQVFGDTNFINFEYKMFLQDNSLHFVNLEKKVSIPIDKFKAIHTVNKRIVLPLWNKEEDYNKGIYKQYKISMNDDGLISLKTYYILEFLHDGDFWGIYFPKYELPAFEKLTGITADK